MKTGVFNKTVNLKKADFSNTRTTIIRAFAFQGSGIKEILMPITLEGMGAYALSDTPNLENVDLLNTFLTKLRMDMFWISGIKRLRFPRYLNEVGVCVFNETHIKYIDASKCESDIVLPSDVCDDIKKCHAQYIESEGECTYEWDADKKQEETPVQRVRQPKVDKPKHPDKHQEEKCEKDP